MPSVQSQFLKESQKIWGTAHRMLSDPKLFDAAVSVAQQQGTYAKMVHNLAPNGPVL